MGVMRWMRGMDEILGLQFYTDGQDGQDLGILPALGIRCRGGRVRVRWVGLDGDFS